MEIELKFIKQEYFIEKIKMNTTGNRFKFKDMELKNIESLNFTSELCTTNPGNKTLTGCGRFKEGPLERTRWFTASINISETAIDYDSFVILTVSD